MTAVALLFIQALVLAVAWFMICRRDVEALKRVGRYISLKSGRPAAKTAGREMYQALDDKMDRLPLTKTLFNLVERLLTVAGVPMKTSEFLSGVAILAGSSLLLQMYMAGEFNALSIVVLLTAPALPFGLLKLRIIYRMKKMRRQLKLAISLLANAMKAGNSFVQALGHVTADMEEPLSSEFRTLLNENRLGIPMEEALNGMFQRVPCGEMQALVRGVIFQQQTGGNLVYVLKTIYQTLQDRDDLRNKISVLTIQGKISGVVCLLVPFFMLLLMHKSNPAYTHILIGTAAGHYLLTICAVLFAVGSALIYKIVAFKF